MTLFDLAGARVPARAAWLLRTAFPEPDPRLVVIVGLLRGASPARAGARVPTTEPEPEEPLSEAAVGAWLDELRPRLPPGASIIAEANPGPRTADGAHRLAAALGPSVARRAILTFSARRGREEFLGGLGELTAPIISTELSLLDASSLGRLASATTHGVPQLIVRDPFAGGRLDGTLLREEMGDRWPGRPPRDVRELRAEFAPVLRLGFLTQQRKRTLAQAALCYLLQRPETLSILLPPPSPERWDEVFASGRVPTLNRAELARLEGLDS